MEALQRRIQNTWDVVEQVPIQWLQTHHPHTYARIQQPKAQKVLLLTAVCLALLLDNMLYMVIVPIIPDYLRHVGAWHTHRLPADHSLTTTPSTVRPLTSSNSLPLQFNTSHDLFPPAAFVKSHPSSSSSSSNSLNQGSHLWNQKVTIKRPLTAAGGRLVYEGEDGAIGILFASKALVQLLINPFSGTLIDRIGAGRPMLFGLLVMFVSTAVFAAGRTYGILLLARSLQGVGSAFADTGGFALLAGRFSQPQEREQALGLALSFVSFGCLFAPPFGALLYEFFGKELPFVVLSLVCLMDGLLVLTVLNPEPDLTSEHNEHTSGMSFKSEVTHILNSQSSLNSNPTSGLYINSTMPLHTIDTSHTASTFAQQNSNQTQTPYLNDLLLQQSRERAVKLKQQQEQLQKSGNEVNNNNNHYSAFPVDLADDWNARQQQSSDSSSLSSSESSPNKSNVTYEVNHISSCTKQPVPSTNCNTVHIEPPLTSVSTCSSPPKQATPIYVLFRDPQIAVCAGALVMANVSLAFLEPTLSIWMVDHLRAQEWQLGLVWLPAFFPYVFGVYSTVRLNHKYPQYKYLVAIGGLLLTGLSCLCLPAVSSYAQLMLPIGSLCFGVAIIDSAVFPTLGYIVDTRYVSVYGSVYAIADISYSLAYAFGPIVAGAIVAWLDFVWLNWIIALLTLGYCPLLLQLRSVQKYERFESPDDGWK